MRKLKGAGLQVRLAREFAAWVRTFYGAQRGVCMAAIKANREFCGRPGMGLWVLTLMRRRDSNMN
jgi:hypothetical protein